MVGLRSGRRKRVTVSIEFAGRALAAFQTLSGRDESSRERAFTLLSQAQVEPESRYAVLDNPWEWEPTVLHEMRGGVPLCGVSSGGG